MAYAHVTDVPQLAATFDKAQVEVEVEKQIGGPMPANLRAGTW